MDQSDPENDKRACMCIFSTVAARVVSRMFDILAGGYVLDTLRFFLSRRTGSCIPLPDKHSLAFGK